jgi:hypothetical protein
MMGWETCPRLHVFHETCPVFIETIPSLPRSPLKPDDADTKAEDHMPDALRYVCMEVGTYARPVLYDDVEQSNPTTASLPQPNDSVPMIGSFVVGD